MKKYEPTIERIKEWKDQIEYCKNNLHKLTEKEIGFIDSCDKDMNDKEVISRRQSKWLRDIVYRIM